MASLTGFLWAVGLLAIFGAGCGRPEVAQPRMPGDAETSSALLVDGQRDRRRFEDEKRAEVEGIERSVVKLRQRAAELGERERRMLGPRLERITAMRNDVVMRLGFARDVPQERWAAFEAEIDRELGDLSRAVEEASVH